jgi:tetratricopeptide (TPR) repeat protein
MTLSRCPVLCGVALFVFSGAASAAAPAADLAAVKALYASAAYEEALSQLTTVDNGADPEQVDQYRALCLIALGRLPEAERSLDQMVVRSPLYRLPDGEVSPRLISLFKDARKRMLPIAARDHYTRAKSSFDDQDFVSAARLFKELQQLTADPDLASEAMSDLKQLADGFLQLSEAAIARAPAPAAPAEAATAPIAIAPVPPTPAIFSADDPSVVAPAEIDRTMPRYTSPPPAFAGRIVRGTLVVVVDERGQVESATLVRPMVPTYDGELLAAARRWRYKFRKLYEIILVPQP